MLLSLLRRIRPSTVALSVSLLLNGVVLANAAPPNVISVSGQCPTTTALWTATEGAFLYQFMLFHNGNINLTQMVPGTTQTFQDLAPGSYTFQVQAFTGQGSSGFSSPYNFTITPCVTCKPPVIQMSADLGTLWPPNGKSFPVTFKGTVQSDCHLKSTTYVLKDSQGSGDDGSVSVAADGSFTITKVLESRRSGKDKNGRVYSLTVESHNDVGSGISPAVNIVVPHDQGN